MSRKKRTKTKRSRPRKPSALRRWWSGMDPDRRGVLLRSMTWTLVVAVVVGGGAWGLKQLERRVLAVSAESAPELGVRLTGRPGWMPSDVLRRIAGDLTADCGGYYDRDLTRRVYENALSEPWISSVKSVRKYRSDAAGLAVVEVEAEYRRPVARAGSNGRYYFVDADGVRLPASEVPQYVFESRQGREYFSDTSNMPSGGDARRLHYIVIELHSEFDPPAPPVGERWNSDALAEGLKLVGRVLGEPYADEITIVDVRNWRSREISNEPELTMFAQAGRHSPTRILFGRFPEPGGDFVVPPERKFAYLDGFYARNGRLGGLASELDLRHDHLLVIP